MIRFTRLIRAYKSVDGVNFVLDVSNLKQNGMGYRIRQKLKTGRGYAKQVDDVPIVSDNFIGYVIALKLLNIIGKIQLAKDYAYKYGGTNKLDEALAYLKSDISTQTAIETTVKPLKNNKNNKNNKENNKKNKKNKSASQPPNEAQRSQCVHITKSPIVTVSASVADTSLDDIYIGSQESPSYVNLPAYWANSPEMSQYSMKSPSPIRSPFPINPDEDSSPYMHPAEEFPSWLNYSEQNGFYAAVDPFIC